MNTFEIAILGICIAGPALVSCAADGSFATKAKPVDLAVSLNRVCTGLKGADLVAKGILSGLAAAGKADPAYIEIEAKAAKTALDFCDPTKPPTDLAGALAAVGVATVDAGDLIAALGK